MIYLLYGPDTQRSRQKLNEIMEEYRRKSGSDLNLYQIDAEEESEDRLREILKTGSLFSSYFLSANGSGEGVQPTKNAGLSLKKLVVIKYFSQSPWDRRKFYKLLEGARDDNSVIVLLWDRELPEKEVKELASYCKKVQEFKSITRQNPESSIFRLGDVFFTSTREGLRSLLDLLYRGHDDFNLFAYLANHARTLLIVKHYLNSGKPLSSKHGIHPFVARKTSAVVRTVPLKNLTGFMKKFFEEDRKIKTGLTRPKDSLLSLLINRES